MVWTSYAKSLQPSVDISSNVPTTHVVVVQNPAATEHFLPQAAELPAMITQGLSAVTGKKNSTQAWQELISSNDVVGIKVFSAPGRTVGTRPELVDALIQSLLSAGISSKQIIIWDKRMPDLYFAGFRDVAARHNVRLEATTAAGWSEEVTYQNAILGTPVWGDLEFEKKGENVGRNSHVSRLLTKEITKIISVSPLLNHNVAGVAGNLYSLSLGSVDNSVRFESSSERLGTAVPEIYALPEISDRVVLCITDALICQYQGQNDTLLHYSTPLNEIWFSKDPVAADVLAISELEHQRKRFGAPVQKLETDIYKNAELLELGTADLKKITVERLQ